MVFVTLGTQDKPFTRLLIEIERLIELGKINGEVIVQAGTTDYQSSRMAIRGFVSDEEFRKNIVECDYMITHAGVGTIMNGLAYGKKMIAVARRVRYGEHENDHQVEITKTFDKEGHILGCVEMEELEEKIPQLETFNVTPYKSNNENFCSLIEQLIDK